MDYCQEMNTIRSFITPKMKDPQMKCDDHFAIGKDKDCFAIADGASSKWCSSIYSQLLVDKYIANSINCFEEENVKKTNAEWKQIVEKIALNGEYYHRNCFNDPKEHHPGSTFLGLRFYQKNKFYFWDAVVLGDCLLLFVPQENDCPTIQITQGASKNDFQYNSQILFDGDPISAFTFNTNWIKNLERKENVKLEKGTFLLMTDELAKWLLKSKDGEIDKRIKKLKLINDQKEFESCIEFIRNDETVGNKQMDDMTLMILDFNNIDNIHFNEKKIYDYRKQIELEKMQEENFRLNNESQKFQDEIIRLKEDLKKCNEEVNSCERKLHDLYSLMEELESRNNKYKNLVKS